MGADRHEQPWDRARENVYWRLDQADSKSRQQDECIDDLHRRISATETQLLVRDARTAWIGWVFAFLGGVLGTVIGGWILWKMGAH